MRSLMSRLGDMARRNAAPLLVLALTAAAVLLRWGAQGSALWLDEGLTIGTASQPLLDIPAALRKDNAPPLYHLILHVWMDVFGSSERATRALSLLFAAAAIPAGYWAGKSLEGRAAGWTCAALAAMHPFLVVYSKETRMYALVGLLSLLVAATFLHAFVHRRRRFVPLFALALLLLVYTHHWGLHVACGAACAAVLCAVAAQDRRRLLADAAAAFGAVGLLYLPWAPTLLFQVQHVGAAWSNPPTLRAAAEQAFWMLTGQIFWRSFESPWLEALGALLVSLGAAAAFATARRADREARTAVIALAVLVLAPLTLGFLFAQARPSWSARYVMSTVGPALILVAVGLSRVPRAGVIAAALLAVAWVPESLAESGIAPPRWMGTYVVAERGNVKHLATAAAPLLRAGDLVVSTWPDQIAVVRYYLGAELRYANPMGPVAQPELFDWCDLTSRMQATSVDVGLEPLVRDLPEGGQLLLVAPSLRSDPEDPNVLINLMLKRSVEWATALASDPRLAEVAAFGRLGEAYPVAPPGQPSAIKTPLYGILYRKKPGT